MPALRAGRNWSGCQVSPALLIFLFKVQIFNTLWRNGKLFNVFIVLFVRVLNDNTFFLIFSLLDFFVQCENNYTSKFRTEIKINNINPKIFLRRKYSFF